MTKRESLDENIAKALVAPDVTVEHLDELIVDCEKALITTKEAATAARERAVDPTVLDKNALAVAIENESYHERYKNARQQLVAKINAIEKQTAHVAWTAEADQIEAEAEALAQEFAGSYKTLVTDVLALAERVNVVNQSAKRLNATRLNGSRMVKELDVIARIMVGVKLPDPQHTDRFLWPVPIPPIRVDMLVPTMTKDSRRYSADWAAAHEEERAAARKRELDEQQRREAEAHAASPNTPRWWAGERFGPERAG